MPNPLIIIVIALFVAWSVAVLRWLLTPPEPTPHPMAHLQREPVAAGVARDDELEPGVVADVEAVLAEKGW